MDYDVIVIGGGPAGLTAATEVAKAGRRVLVLERESFGGRVMNTEWIEDWPAPGERIEGPKLGTQLVDAARAAGVTLELGEVIEAESYSSTRSVTTADGKAYTASALIVASGLRNKVLGIPGEEAFQGKGVIHCAFCDAGLYRGQNVVVCGGGDAGFTEALLLARYAQRVVLLEQAAAPSASPALQAAAREVANLEIRTGQTLAAVKGHLAVTSVDVRDVAGGSTTPLAVTGVLVQCGFEPATEAVAAVVDLDDANALVADDRGNTPARGLLAAGDVRAGASRRVAAAIADGRRTAETALQLLA